MKHFITLFLLVYTFNTGFSQITKEHAGNFILKGKHTIGISIGINNKTSAHVSGANVETKLGFSGGLFYDYGISNEFTMGFYTGYLHGEVNTMDPNTIYVGEMKQTTAFVMPVFIGTKYYPSALSIENYARPYLSLHAGILSGFTTSENIYIYMPPATETKTQSVFAGKVGAGMDFAPAKWVRLGFFTGYLFAADFKEPVGTMQNYSGVEFNFVAGIVL